MRQEFYKKNRTSFIIYSLTCAVFFFLIYLPWKNNETKNGNEKAEYLIDIYIENKQNIEIDFIQLGVVLNGKDEEIINEIQGKYVQEENMHFAISYSPNTPFFLKGKAQGINIEPCYFSMKKYSNIYQPQKIKFYIDNFTIYKYED